MKRVIRTLGFGLMAALVFLCGFSGTSRAEGQESGYSRGSTSWYIGFGIGGGASVETHAVTPCSSLRGGVDIMFKVGRVIRHDFLIGYDVAGSGVQARHEGKEYLLNLQHHEIMVSYFPLDSAGLFAKGGVGLAARSWDEADKLITESFDFGFDMRTGAGYEFQLGDAFNLGVEIGYAVSFFEEGTSQDIFALLSFSWY